MRHTAIRLALSLALALPLLVQAAEKKQYLVVAPHAPEECLAALDGMAAEKKLDAWEWGCLDGDHTGYLMVRAASKEEALASVPANQRSKARAVELGKFTAAQVASLHRK